MPDSKKDLIAALLAMADAVERGETVIVSSVLREAAAVIAGHFLQPGNRVIHTGLKDHGEGTGVVETVDSEGTVTVLFDASSVSGKPFRGVYDAQWFRTHPAMLQLQETE